MARFKNALPWPAVASLVFVAAVAASGDARAQQPIPPIPPPEESNAQPIRKPSDPYRPGPDVTLPRVTKEVRPKYTQAAMARGIQGTVWIECVVGTDGKITDTTVTKSLDSVHGLDQEAVKAARKWRFTPGRRLGKPVAMLITIEMTFTLKK